MERQRVMRRKILPQCCNLKLYKMPDGSVRKPSCRKVCETSNIQTIDTFPVPAAIKSLERCTYSENTLIQECIHTSALGELCRQPYLSVDFPLTFKNVNALITNNNLYFYHRRNNFLCSNELSV